MKLRRMKLVALAMSALMVTSALPMTAFAEEEVFYEEVADEALVGDSAEEETYFEDGIVFEEDVDAFEEDTDFVFEEEESSEETVGEAHGDGTDTPTTKETKKWDGNDPVQDGEKWYINVNVFKDGSLINTERVEVETVEDTTPATCKKDGSVVVSFKKKDDVGFETKKTVTLTVPSLGGEHEYERVEKDWGIYDPMKCSPDASYTYKKKCKYCGELLPGPFEAKAKNGHPDEGQTLADTQFETADWIAHDPDAVVTVTIDKDSLVNLKLIDKDKLQFSTLADAKANVELKSNTKRGTFDVIIQKYCKICNTSEFYDSKGNVVSRGAYPTEKERIVVVPAEFRDYKYAKVVSLLPDADNDLEPGIPNVRGLKEGSNSDDTLVNGAGKKVLFRDDFINAHSDEPDALIDKEGNLRPGVLERLVLANCEVAGAYKVAFVDDDDIILAYSDWIDIPAHHVYGAPVFEFKKEAERNKCVPIISGGKVEYFATNCTTDINYEVVYHCLNLATCPLKNCKVSPVYSTKNGNKLTTADELKAVGSKVDPSKTVKATATKEIHNYSKIKDQVKKIIDQASIKGKKVDLNELESLILVDPTGKTAPRTDLIDKDVRIKNNNICDGGTVTVEYVCKKCGHVDSVDIEVDARDHFKGDLIMKVEKEATCTETGKNVAIANCVYCGKELDKKENIIAKKPHSNQKEVTVSTNPKKIEIHDRVDDNYALTHAMIGVKGSVVVGPKTIIDRDGRIKFSDDYYEYGTTVRGIGTSIGARDTVGQTTEDEFLGVQFYLYTPCEWCGEHIAAVQDQYYGKSVSEKFSQDLDINDFVVKVVDYKIPAANDVAGSITFTATYKYGNREISLGPVSYPWYQSWASYAARSDGNKTEESGNPDTHVHKEGVAEVQNLVEATCDKAGSYDLVSKCTECGEVVSTLHVIEHATGHSFGSWQTSKKATVFTTGTQKRTCSKCKKAETRSIAKLPSIIKLNKTAVTVKVGKSATVKVSKWNLKDYIAPTAEGGVKASNKNISAFKTGSYTLKIKGKKAGSSTVTVKMKAGATATIKVTVKK